MNIKTLSAKTFLDVSINAKCIWVRKIHVTQILVDQSFRKKGSFHQQFSEIGVYFGS